MDKIVREIDIRIKDSKKTLEYKQKISECLEQLSLSGDHRECLYLIKKMTSKNIPELKVFIQLLPIIINKLIPWERVNILTELKTLNIKIPEYQENDNDAELFL